MRRNIYIGSTKYFAYLHILHPSIRTPILCFVRVPVLVLDLANVRVHAQELKAGIARACMEASMSRIAWAPSPLDSGKEPLSREVPSERTRVKGSGKVRPSVRSVHPSVLS